MKHYLKRYTLAIFSLFILSGAIAQNVGIGTSNPINPFTVRAAGEGIAQESTDSSTRIGFYVVPHFAYLQTDTKDNLLFSTNNGAIQMVLDTAGRVGIATAAPQANLDVNGSVKLLAGTPGTAKVLTSDAVGNATWQASGSSTGFEYGSNSNQTVHNLNNVGYYDTLHFGSLYYDPATAFDGTYYTVPVTGLYHFDVHIYWSSNSTAGTYGLITALSNGSQFAQTVTPIPPLFGGGAVTELSSEKFLIAGQKVHVEVSQSSSVATMSEEATPLTNFSGYKVD
jgi:hypothetical protein